ncbi:MAG: phosphatidate cytidylyltransferase [Treponema sp.]|jgi:phosphatidate cytidylyltransferase|nr:phosphatidate cytidylyltransferase [Treponema sp.]
MNKIVQRLLIFFIGIPVVVAVVLLPYKNHLVMNIVIVVLCSIGAAELGGLFRRKGVNIPSVETVVLGSLIPGAMALFSSFHINEDFLFGVMILAAIWIVISRVFCKGVKLKHALEYMGAGFAALLYPGFFMSWIIRMTRWQHAAFVIIVFLLMVISNDSAAWAFGMLFGKNNRGIIPASPNKSVAGYTGGLVSSMLIGLCAAMFFPQILESRRYPVIPAIASGIFIGFVTGITASLGDLTESVMKRSANAKDSGFIIPGRGGVLDSIDSIALAAPVFYVVYWFFFT